MVEIRCKQCNRPMTLLDEDKQRFYCYKDDLIFLSNQNKWSDEQSPVGENRPQYGPICESCGKPMQQIGRVSGVIGFIGDPERWYCLKDDKYHIEKQGQLDGQAYRNSLPRLRVWLPRLALGCIIAFFLNLGKASANVLVIELIILISICMLVVYVVDVAKRSSKPHIASDSSMVVRKPDVIVRRKTSSLILLAIICVVPSLALGYFLITPSIPIDQTIIGYTTESLFRTYTPYITTTAFSCWSGYSYVNQATATTCVGLFVRVTPVLVSNSFTTSYSYTSTNSGVSTVSPYALSQGMSIALILGAVVLAGIFFHYLGRTRQANPEIESASQPSSKQQVEPKKEAAKSMTKFCRECGTKIPRDSLFCEKCGTNLS